MSDTVTIRPTHASDLKVCDRIRTRGSTETVTRIEDSPNGLIRIFTDDDRHVRCTIYHSYIVDVVTDEPGPEEHTWPTSPLIRVTRTKEDDVTPGCLALRDPEGRYVIIDSVVCTRGSRSITEWEDLVPVRADLLCDLEAANMAVRAFEPERLSDRVRALYRTAALIIADSRRTQP